MGMEQCELEHWEGRGRTFLYPEHKDQNPLEGVAEEGAPQGHPFEAARAMGRGVLAAV